MVGVGGGDIQVLHRGPERNDAVGPLMDAHEQVGREPPVGPEEELLLVVVVVVVVLLVPSPQVLQVAEAHPADHTQQLQGGHTQEERMGGRDTDSQQEAGAFLQQQLLLLLLLHVVAPLPRQKDQAVPVMYLPAPQVALAETVGLPVPFHHW